MTRVRSSGIVIVLACMLMLPVFAQVTPTPYAMDFYGNATLDGAPIPVGAVVTAYDPDGVWCGEFTVTTVGQYGFLPVYGNDSTTDVDEGAVAGDTISFRINGYDATVVSGTTTWTNMGQEEVVLSVMLPSPPVITSATASPSTIVANGTDTTVLNVTATDPDGIVASVIVDLSAIGGSATQVLTPIGDDTWQCTTVARFVGSFNLPVNVTDNDGTSNTSVSISLTTVEPGVATTPFAMNFYGNATLDDEPIPVGAVITAYDPDRVLCGVWTVTTVGEYGFMPVYGDDPDTTDVDEGAVDGDTISFRICGYDATVVSGTTIWTNMDQQAVVLSAVATAPPPPPPPSRRGGGGGGAGTYPPGWFATPTVTATAVPGVTPTVTATTVTQPEEAVTTPTKTTVAEKTPVVPAVEEPTKKKGIPGFTAVFAIAGMLAIAYAMMRRRE